MNEHTSTPAVASEIRRAIDGILALPASSAGFNSTQLRAVLDQLGTVKVMADEFFEFTDEARTVIATVASALLSMRENALERENEQRFAFGHEQEEARKAAEDRARAEAIAAAPPVALPELAAPAIEVLPPEPDLPGLIETADQFADEVRPDDEEIIAVLCERFDLVPPQVIDLLARFDFAAARVRHAI